MRWLPWILLVLALASCASHRKLANCEEIRYRLDHSKDLEYNDDQRAWIEEEWKACMVEYDTLKEHDRINHSGIYAQFSDSTGVKLSSSSQASSSASLGTASADTSGTLEAR